MQKSTYALVIKKILHNCYAGRPNSFFAFL